MVKGGLTTRGPRNLLRQIREAMAGGGPAQERLDMVVRTIAQSMVAEVCSIYLRRASGYYIDVGACDLVIDGSIKLQAGKQISHLSENAVVLADGTELPADLVVYATGYGSMNGWVADLISQEVADKVGKVWGLGSDTTKDPGPWEGEQRNMWKPTQQEALWFHGGNLHQSRHYSLYLALQLKARQEGLPVRVYDLQQVHHLR